MSTLCLLFVNIQHTLERNQAREPYDYIIAEMNGVWAGLDGFKTEHKIQ